jgi:hypothetical protein
MGRVTSRLALGAQADEARIRKIATEAGFTHFRRAAETSFNIVFEAKLWREHKRPIVPLFDRQESLVTMTLPGYAMNRPFFTDVQEELRIDR